MRILAVLGIEMTTCVTILARKTSPPPPPSRPWSAPTHRAGSAEIKEKGKWELGRLRSARSEDSPRAKAGAIKQESHMRAIRAKMIDEPPVECFHAGQPARQNGNKGQITIQILGGRPGRSHFLWNYCKLQTSYPRLVNNNTFAAVRLFLKSDKNSLKTKLAKTTW